MSLLSVLFKPHRKYLEYHKIKVKSNKYIIDFWSYFKSEKDMWIIKLRVYWQLYWINAKQITRMYQQWKWLDKLLVFLLFQIKINNQFYYLK